MNTKGCERDKSKVHHALSAPANRCASLKSGYRQENMKISETQLAQPYQGPRTLKASPAAACHTGNSWGEGAPFKLNPTMIGCSRLIGPLAYSSAVPR